MVSNKGYHGHNRCGDGGHHFYNGEVKQDTCLCGQVPVDIFFVKGCTCGAGHDKNPIHTLDCAYVQWSIRRNDFIRAHRTNPPLRPTNYKVKEANN